MENFSTPTSGIAAKEGEILKEINRLDSFINELNDVLQTTKKRVEPVTRAATPADTEMAKANELSPCTDLGRSLRTKSETLGKIIDDIRNLNYRIEL
jgi:hypothetical protein